MSLTEQSLGQSYSLGDMKENDTLNLNVRRRAALSEIDEAPFSWFHVKVCFVTSVGFFSDAYDLFAIDIAAIMLGFVYSQDFSLSNYQSFAIKVASPVGTVFGQLLFGWLADLVGRKRMYGIEMVIMIVSTFGQALSSQGPAVDIIGVLVVWRFFTGVGIGGDYPLSAVIASEFSSVRIRGRVMTAIVAAQGWGQFSAAIISLISVIAYKNAILEEPFPAREAVDHTWRLLIGLGCVPAVCTLFFRLTIPETPRFTMDIERNVDQATSDIQNILADGTFVVNQDAPVQRVRIPRATRRDFMQYFSKWQNLKVLIGAAYSWFALDIAFYGLNLNSSVILGTIGFGMSDTCDSAACSIYENLKNSSVGNIILSVAGLIPGFWVCFLFIDRWGRKPIQLMGFVILAILFCIMGFAYDKFQSSQQGKIVFVFLYCLANFFSNFGPNTTVFIIPGEAFPTRYRSTAHGIAAACGKIGAVISQVIFALNGRYVNRTLGIFGVLMLTGISSTLLVPETKGRSLEDLSNEDQVHFVQ